MSRLAHNLSVPIWAVPPRKSAHLGGRLPIRFAVAAKFAIEIGNEIEHAFILMCPASGLSPS
jgi:hypothetical protein